MNTKLYKSLLVVIAGLTASAASPLFALSESITGYAMRFNGGTGICDDLGNCEGLVDRSTASATTLDDAIDDDDDFVNEEARLGSAEDEKLTKFNERLAVMEASYKEAAALDTSSAKRRYQKDFEKLIERMNRELTDYIADLNEYKALSKEEYTKDVRREQKDLIDDMKKEYEKFRKFHAKFIKRKLKHLS